MDRTTDAWKLYYDRLMEWMDERKEAFSQQQRTMRNLEDRYKQSRDQVARALAERNRLCRSTRSAAREADQRRREAHRAIAALDVPGARRSLGECQTYLMIADTQSQQLQSTSERLRQLEEELSGLEREMRLARRGVGPADRTAPLGTAKMPLTLPMGRSVAMASRRMVRSEAELAAMAQALVANREQERLVVDRATELELLSRQLDLADHECGELEERLGEEG